MAGDKSPSKDGSLNSLMNKVQSSMDSMYQNTYYNSPFPSKRLDDLNTRINNAVDKIVNYNMNTTGMPSISKLYARMDLGGNTGFNDVSSMFDGAITFDDFYSNFMQNRYLVEVDAEIDAVCKYFPELLEALDIKKEGVLSADHFSKDFLTILRPESEDEAIFNDRCKNLKDTYNLLNLIDEAYDNAAKYGEQFLYVVPYSTALSRLLSDKHNTMSPASLGLGSHFHEAVIDESALDKENERYMVSLKGKSFDIFPRNGSRSVYTTEAVIIESADGKDKKPIHSVEPLLNNNESFNIEVELCRSGIIESFIKDTAKVANRKNNIIESVSSQFISEMGRSITEKKDLKIVRKDDNGKLKIDGMEDAINNSSGNGLVADGIFNINRSNQPTVKVKVPGCVLNKVKREQVIPIYIGDSETCLGYYYIELRSVEAMQDFQGYNYMMSDSLTSLRGSNSGMNAPFNVIDPTRQEEMLRFLSAQLSRFIDKEFVQANQDLRSEIYMILKQNDLFNTPSIDKIKVTFVPPEDMIHIYFKLDPTTHRGISDLERAMIPAKIYASLYITDAIGQLCRGQDKRVFYVKQNVETNISKTLLNTIQQIKQGNFGLRQFSNINNVLNITGKFNDYFIPLSPSGDSPVQIEVLPGQQFTDNSDRMQSLKEMAVESTDVPFEMIQTRKSVDFAMQLSMSSSKFLRKIYHRQARFTPFLSRLVTKLYNYEYSENLELEVTLPPPMFLNMANTSQLIDNTKQFIQNSTEFETASMQDNEKNIYYNELFKFYIGTHIDLSQHERVLKQSLAKAAVDTPQSKAGEEGY